MPATLSSFSILESSKKTLNQKHFYSFEQLALLKESSLPRHVAIIMDGNRRWAKQRSSSGLLPRWLPRLPSLADGHQAGAAILYDIVQAASQLHIEVLTVYGFSTENWWRPPIEVEALISICESYLINYRQSMVEEGVRLSVIGDLTPFPLSLKKAVHDTIEATKEGKAIEFVIALNYGARDELKRTMQKLAHLVLEKKITPEEISEKTIEENLDTASWPPVDLVIRTSGEMRLSNFLLWQSAYAEIYITPDYWPDFSPQHLYDGIVAFSQRERRQGT